jgi:hypothetical protein
MYKHIKNFIQFIKEGTEYYTQDDVMSIKLLK